MAIARKIGDQAGVGSALGNLGIAYRNSGDMRQAIDYHEQALAVSREIGDRRGEGAALWNSAVDLHSLGERDEAVARAEAALAIYEAIEDPNTAILQKGLTEWRGSPK